LSPVSPQKNTISAKEPCISAKETYISAREPHIPAKEPYIPGKEPYISAKESCISAKDSCISATEPCISAKEPCISVTSLTFPQKSPASPPKNRAFINTQEPTRVSILGVHSLIYPGFFAKETHTSTKEPYDLLKGPYIYKNSRNDTRVYGERSLLSVCKYRALLRRYSGSFAEMWGSFAIESTCMSIVKVVSCICPGSISNERAPYLLKRAIHLCKRALHLRQRTLHLSTTLPYLFGLYCERKYV